MQRYIWASSSLSKTTFMLAKLQRRRQPRSFEHSRFILADAGAGGEEANPKIPVQGLALFVRPTSVSNRPHTRTHFFKTGGYMYAINGRLGLCFAAATCIWRVTAILDLAYNHNEMPIIGSGSADRVGFVR